MNLKNLTDKALLNGTEKSAQAEQEATINLLHHLLEIERRRLFSSLKYPSLFAYVVGELKYPEDRAARRISAARLLRDVPQIEPKVTTGELSLTNMVMAQTLFAKEKKAGKVYTPEQKLEVLERLENVSTREAKKIVTEINPEMGKKPGLDFNSIEDDGLRIKLLRVRDFYAHTNPNMTLPELLNKLCEEKIAEKTSEKAQRKTPEKTQRKAAGDATRKAPDNATEKVPAQSAAQTESPAAPRVESVAASAASESSEKPENLAVASKFPRAKYAEPPAKSAAAQIRREVRQRDNHRCTNCGSTHALEIDHIIPRAKGGPSTAENMRLLCRACNQRWAIECYGDQKMNQFLKEPEKGYSAIFH